MVLKYANQINFLVVNFSCLNLVLTLLKQNIVFITEEFNIAVGMQRAIVGLILNGSI